MFVTGTFTNYITISVQRLDKFCCSLRDFNNFTQSHLCISKLRQNKLICIFLRRMSRERDMKNLERRDGLIQTYYGTVTLI